MAARGFSDDDVPPIDAPMRVRNPLMAAAARLLALAAAVQADRQVADVARLRARADGEAKAFEKTLSGLGLSSEDNARARYAVLATVDDIVQNLPGGANSDWPRRSLVVVSFGQAFGGDQFFTILDTMLQRPAAHLEMLELYHACLAVGFQGRLRTLPDGNAQIAARMGSIYNQLSSIRPRPETDLSPAWTGVPTPMPRLGWLVRAAIVAAIALAVLLLVFLGAKLLLDSRDHPAFLGLRQLPPVTPARIDRVGGDVVKPSGQLERVRAPPDEQVHRGEGRRRDDPPRHRRLPRPAAGHVRQGRGRRRHGVRAADRRGGQCAEARAGFGRGRRAHRQRPDPAVRSRQPTPTISS